MSFIWVVLDGQKRFKESETITMIVFGVCSTPT